MMTELHSFIRDRFDRQALQYLRNPITRWVGLSEINALRAMIPPEIKTIDKNRALDYGCGTGRVTTMLLELGFKVTGFDISEGMLERARFAFSGHSDVSFTADLGTLADQWPLIVALGVLDYYQDSSLLWTEWKRLLARDGILLVTVPNARSPLAWLYTFLSRFTCQAYATTAERLQSIAKEYGFSMIDMKTVFPQAPWGHTIVLAFQLDVPNDI